MYFTLSTQTRGMSSFLFGVLRISGHFPLGEYNPAVLIYAGGEPSFSCKFGLSETSFFFLLLPRDI